MKEIHILQTQISELNKKDFDLEAWKQHTVIILSRIFGSTDIRIQQIKNLEYDYSSWALRDTSGKSTYLDSCKKLGKEILEASIQELENFGLPGKNKGKEEPLLLQILSDELRGADFRVVKEIVGGDDSAEVKKRKLKKLFKKVESELPLEIILRQLTHPDF